MLSYVLTRSFREADCDAVCAGGGAGSLEDAVVLNDTNGEK